MNRHPSDEEAAEVKAKYKQKLCSYGDLCQTEGCLYFHPFEAEIAIDDQGHAFTDEIASDVQRLDLGDQKDSTPSYEDWLAHNCPAPTHMGVNQINDIWFYTSGLQRDPWEVYNLMYPHSSNGANHSAAPQTWEPLASASQLKELNVMSHSWNSACNDSMPVTCEEWKKMGCPYPSWFLSDIDPWYDDEGIRLSLEEVYEVLYGENAQARFEEKEALRYKLEIRADPTPAELLAKEGAQQNHIDSTTVNKNNSCESSGGWAQIASKPAINTNNKVHSSHNNAPTSSANTKSEKNKTIIMPKECWLPSTDNSNYFVSHPDPIERFKAINQQHESHFASISIPTSLDGSNPEGNVALLDVHFQSSKSIITVLNRFLPPALNQNEEVWIISGMGTHVEAGHQKRGNSQTGGVLFNSVKKYLMDKEATLGIEWRFGKEAVGAKYANGSFLVRKKK
jgi:hypothetical protein